MVDIANNYCFILTTYYTSLTCYRELDHDKKYAAKQSTLDLVFKEYIVNMYVNLIINFC